MSETRNVKMPYLSFWEGKIMSSALDYNNENNNKDYQYFYFKLLYFISLCIRL